LKTTGNKQEPYVYGSLGGNDLPLVSAKPTTGSQADPQSSVRRDYELALQAGERDAWEAFLQAYPDGFYANLAKVQLRKIAAEEARSSAAEKARAAEEERARLAAEGARQAEQAKAAAAAKAAEQARLAAEKAKQLEQDKAAAAEKARLAEQEKVRLAAEKARLVEQEKVAAAEQARLAAEKATQEKKLAALSPAGKQEEVVTDLPRTLQAELRRVGCATGSSDGKWNTTSQKALDLFNKHAGMKLDVKVASVDALSAVKGKTGRVCPLMCEHGFKVDGDRCTKITCRAGYEVGDNNTCEKVETRKPAVKREEPKPNRDAGRKPESENPKSQASGQIYCSASGCRPVQRGCRIVQSKIGLANSGSNGGAGLIEVCN
jgi:hypothetical protein